ncbi:MAG: nucleotidyl transferase AbiEii/AbiGii toxin family protein [Ignavibacteria bacterium]|nr:nucleotidyl transferase AbiEii/AbiGii toxin family protein [Ignavibacteria bacterium]
MAKVNSELQALEVFEIEILNLLNKQRIIDQLYFGGGTMLRLCHNLNRYSTDLDFWLKKEADADKIFTSLQKSFSDFYQIIDAQNKHFTIVFQIKSPNSKRSLKIEIRKEQIDFEWERKIAFSKYTTLQVQVQGLTLTQMMRNKTASLISRKVIRDCFDIDFLFKRGIPLVNEKENLIQMLDVIKDFKEKDFKVTLGSLLDAKERDFYNNAGFTLLQQEITALINNRN